MKKYLVLVTCAVAFAVPPALAEQRVPTFSAREAQWLQANPIVLFASDGQLRPLEYVEDGEFKGLTAEYLDFVSKKTGIEFKFVRTESWDDAQAKFARGEVMLLPNVMEGRLASQLDGKVLLSRPYLAATSVVFTDPNAPAVMSMDQLNGKVVAARTSGMYAEMIERTYPHLRVMGTPTPEAALAAVVSGEADAAMGTSMTFHPFMRRKYLSELNLSHPEISLVMLAQMGSASDQPELASIIDKALGTMTTGEESALRDRWLRETDYGAPTMGSIFKYNGPYIVLLALSAALLVLLAHRANVAKRLALESERVKARFLATMSHEIRTPINAVVGAVEMLLQSPLDDSQRKLASIAVQGADVLDALLDNVLDLSKLQERHMRLEMIPTDLDALVSRTVDMFRAMAEAKSIALYTDLESLCGRQFLIDPTRLRQVVMNLVSNALKFTDHGEIRVSGRVRRIAGEDMELTVEVADTGVGIADADHAAIFEAYRQADAATTRQYGGTGLGLSICNELIQLMGGEISLKSELGKGTRVTFVIPVKAMTSDGTPSVHRNGIARQAAEGKETVLVVDDHADNRFIISEQLSRLGYANETAASADEAIDSFKANRYAMIFMDCHMPKKDGYQASKMIRELELTLGLPPTPIIAISAATDAAHLERCMDSGMDGVLKKPLRIDDIRAILLLWLTSHHDSASMDDVQTDFTIEELKTRYQQSILADLNEIELAVFKGELTEVKRLAHRINGAAGMAQDPLLATWAQELEVTEEIRAETAAQVERMRGRVLNWQLEQQ